MRNLSVICAVALLMAPSFALAANEPAPAPQIAVGGDLPKSGPLTLDELKSLGPIEKAWTMHGQTHKVVGVRLDSVLKARGFTAGKMGKDVPKSEKRAGWRKIVLVTAADGFQALFSCAEIAEEMGTTVALLAWEIDGAPLDAEHGPVRLIVITDQEPSRSIFGVRRIEVIDVAAQRR